jgi:eukaryotic-like serine/threonine-protein kinase
VTSPGATHDGGGRYTILAEIGSSDLVTVHLGRLVTATGSARTVAIERFRPELVKQPDFVTTLLEETRLVLRVKHPNVLPILDVVRDQAELLLVTEYVPGESLARLSEAVLARRERFDPRVASTIVLGVLTGLHAAHEAQNEFGEPLEIVHRHLSPRSVLVGADGIPRVKDLGLGKLRGQDLRTRASTPEERAELAHLSPEQVRGGTVTRLTDVWAAGVVLWETLAGKPLFASDDPNILLRSIVSAEVPDLSSVAPDAPPALGAVVKKALARAPGGRFPTARAMALAIEQAVPLALPAEVSEYVERICGEAIGQRKAQVHEAETASPAIQGAGIIPSAEFIADALWSNLPKGSPAPAPAPAPAHPPAPALELAPIRPKRPPPPPPKPPSAARWAIPLVVVVALALAVLAAGPLLVPTFAKQKAVAAAQARGVSLSIDSASGGYTAIHFRGVVVTVPDVPGLRVAMGDIDVDLSFFRPVHASLRDVDVNLDGSFLKTLANVTTWYRGHRGGTEEAPTDGMRVEVPNAKLAWTHVFGDDARIDAAGVLGELSPKASVRLGDELHFTTSKLSMTSKAGTVGPWRVDVEQDPNATTVRVAFDPPVPDGPNAIVTYMSIGWTQVDVNIPRQPLARLGVPSSDLASLRHPPDQADLKVHYVRTIDNRVDATLAVGVYGLEVPPMPGTTEVHFAGAVGGDGRSPMDLAGGTLSVGPVKATLIGRVVLRADGASGNLAWRAMPIPCEKLLPKTAKAATDLAEQLGGLGTGTGTPDVAMLGADVAALAQAAGIAKASGTLAASGKLVFDTNDLASTTLTVEGKNTCGVTILGGSR